MGKFQGIQVYEILENGNLLNGIYSNANLQPIIDSEIARKKQFDSLGVQGDYDCIYLESGNNSAIKCELEISQNSGIYSFTWTCQNGQKWKGLGLMAGTHHIAVSYDEA